MFSHVVMAVIKTYWPLLKLIAYFIFKQKYVIFFVFFMLSIFAPPHTLNKCILPPSILRTFPMELEYPENIKNSLNGIYYRFSEKYG